MRCHPQVTPLEGIWWLSTALLLKKLMKMKTFSLPLFQRPASGTSVGNPQAVVGLLLQLVVAQAVVVMVLQLVVGAVEAVVVVAGVVEAVDITSVTGWLRLRLKWSH